MTAYKDRSKEELLQEKSQLEAQYKEFQDVYKRQPHDPQKDSDREGCRTERADG